MRSDNEEALRHVLKDACEQVHLEYSKLLHPMVVQRQKDAVFSLGIEFSIKHPLFALLVDTVSGS